MIKKAICNLKMVYQKAYPKIPGTYLTNVDPVSGSAMKELDKVEDLYSIYREVEYWGLFEYKTAWVEVACTDKIYYVRDLAEGFFIARDRKYPIRYEMDGYVMEVSEDNGRIVHKLVLSN